jgi:hypothetical protein
MKNQLIATALRQLRLAIDMLPNSSDKDETLVHFQNLEKSAEKADADERYNPAGKTIIRNKNGLVIGRQG